MVNKVILIGNVGKDPEIRQVGDNKVANFTLATSERYKDKNGEVKEQTEWHNIVIWDAVAGVVEKYVNKGSQVYIEGKIRTRSYDDKDGNKRYTTEILGSTLKLLGHKTEGGAQKDGSDMSDGITKKAGAPQTHQESPFDDMPDDLPF